MSINSVTCYNESFDIVLLCFFLFLIIFWLSLFSDAAVANILWREEGTAVKFFCRSDNVLVCFSNSMMGHSPPTCH